MKEAVAWSLCEGHGFNSRSLKLASLMSSDDSTEMKRDDLGSMANNLVLGD